MLRSRGYGETCVGDVGDSNTVFVSMSVIRVVSTSLSTHALQKPTQVQATTHTPITNPHSL